MTCMKKSHLLFLAALALTACGSDEPANPAESAAAQVTASIDRASSRAHDTSWEAGDAIGISAVQGGLTAYSNMMYVSDGASAFAHEGGEASGIFFQDVAETEFSAYYPFTGSENTPAGVITGVKTDDQTAQKDFDFLFAAGARASRTRPTLSFTGDAAFSHRMTRLVLRLVTDANSGFSASDVASGSYFLSGLRHSGTFDTSTGVAAASGEPSDSWQMNAPADLNGNSLTFSLILYPQENADIELTAEIGGVSYTCMLSPALAAGVSYSYTVTVRKTRLEVSGSTITDWTDGGGDDIEAVMPQPLGSKTPEEASVGDFYMADGSVAGKDTALTARQKAGCVGIVFAVGHAECDDSDYSSTGIGSEKCHGYAVALRDASGKCMWGESGKDLGLYPIDPATGQPYNTYKEEFADKDWNGFNHTRRIIETAGGIDKLGPGDASGYPATYYTVVACQNSTPAPSNTSGWFLPSSGQLWRVFTTKVLDNGDPAEALSTVRVFWASTEISSIPTYSACILRPVYTDIDGWTKSSQGAFVRPVFAF